MKNNFNIKSISLIVSILLPGINHLYAQGTWVQKANVGGGTRTAAIGFSIGTKGYIGLGNGKIDLWEYNPANNSWTQEADFPGSPLMNAVGFSTGSNGYVGTGLDTTSMPINDFWSYVPSGNVWFPVSPFPGIARRHAAAFSIGNKGYVGTGVPFQQILKDFWEFNNGIWTQKADFGGGKRYMASGFSIGNKGYLGLGDDTITGRRKDFWEYDPASNTWTQKADYPLPIDGATAFSIGGRGYICAGSKDTTFGGVTPTKALWAYNPSQNSWVQKADIPGSPRDFAAGFVIGNKGYVGTGYSPFPGNEFYEYTPDCFNTITASGATTICVGESITLTANAGSSYIWSTGANTQSITVGTAGTYSVTVNGCQEGQTVTITVVAKPQAVITASSVTSFCSGLSGTLYANTGAGLSYQWLKGGNTIAGATASSYIAATGGVYKVIVINASGCTRTSPGKTVTVNPVPPAAITPNGPLTFCAGGNVVFTTSTGAGYSYRWKKNNVSIAGATNISYTATTAGKYKVRVTNSFGCTQISVKKTVSVPCREAGEKNQFVRTQTEAIAGENSVNAFPVPVKDLLNLEVKNFGGKGWVHVMNELGQTVISKEMDFDIDGLKVIDMNQLSRGSYSILIKTNEKNAMVKVMKE